MKLRLLYMIPLAFLLISTVYANTVQLKIQVGIIGTTPNEYLDLDSPNQNVSESLRKLIANLTYATLNLKQIIIATENGELYNWAMTKKEGQQGFVDVKFQGKFYQLIIEEVTEPMKSSVSSSSQEIITAALIIILLILLTIHFRRHSIKPSVATETLTKTGKTKRSKAGT